jgi:hypothetical protein
LSRHVHDAHANSCCAGGARDIEEGGHAPAWHTVTKSDNHHNTQTNRSKFTTKRNKIKQQNSTAARQFSNRDFLYQLSTVPSSTTD